jgi:sigma-E factor negative regulatory protein RseA
MNMKDQLSALMDGEFDIASSEHLITSAKSGGELKSCWAHYHLIGDTLRGETHMSHDFSYRVMSALETEPTVLVTNLSSNTNTSTGAASRTSATQSFYNKSTKFWSAAASVAAVMFVGVMVMQQQLNQPQPAVTVQIAEQLAPVEIAQSVPTEYLQAHQAAAPSSAAYYIQTASFSEQSQ